MPTLCSGEPYFGGAAAVLPAGDRVTSQRDVACGADQSQTGCVGRVLAWLATWPWSHLSVPVAGFVHGENRFGQKQNIYKNAILHYN